MTKKIKDTEESKEVAVKQSTEVSTEFAGMFDQGLQSSGDEMDAEDIRLPKLTLIQGMTKSSFNTESVGVGNYINSIEKMDMGNELDLFIMNDTKLWQWDYMTPQGKNKPDKKEYLTITDFSLCPNIRKNWSPDNIPAEVLAKMEYKEIKFEQLCPPDQIYRFFVLLVEEVKAGGAFPYIIDFKRSSAGEGNKLKNIFFKMRRTLKLPSYAKVFKLSSEFVQDEFDYFVKSVSSGRNIEKEELEAVETWVRELATNATNYSVDEEDNAAEGGNDEAIPAESAPVDPEQPKF